MFQRLLTLVDGSPLGMRALPYAVWLAAAANGEVTLLRTTSADEQREDVEWDLARVVGRLRRQGVAARALVDAHEQGRTLDAILAAQATQRADLIVLATHGGRGPDRALWGSTADAVLRQAPPPVLLVPKRSQRTWPRRRPLRVILSLDRADPVEPLLALVNHLAAVTAIQLLLAAGIDAVDFPAPNGRSCAVQAPAPRSERLQERLDAVASHTRAAGMDTTVQLGAALPLAEVAREEQSDLIVMATDGRLGSSRILFGDPTPGPIYRSPVPMLLIRPAGAPPPPAQHTNGRGASGRPAPRPSPPAGPPGIDRRVPRRHGRSA